ncbi:unnamed protein product [Mytilus edulis]|uniref:SMP-30/Gluconolactonase/LRE-like region domain-containing protein n=1 Tax=Mytilus edulis TaxID=6550 RepID=A0A8S3S1N9_MYTED|nr:unnamed protein product [Mytilus edulis]
MPSTFRFERKIKINRSDDILITKMGITNDNRLLLCNNSETHLLVYSVSGDYLHNCELSGRSRYIAVIPGTEKAVVTLPIDLAIQYVDIKTMNAGSMFSVPFGCRGVAIVNDKICVGGYSERGKIRILEMNGKRIKILKIPKAGYITNLDPGPDDSLYYSDTECNTVGNITLEGEEIFRYNSADFIGPTAISTDKKGNLYVACEGSNNIQRITSNGEFLDIILDTENNVYCPTDIIFSNDHGTLFYKMGDCQDPGAYITMLWYKMGDCQDPGAYITMLWCKMGNWQDPGAHITVV